MTDIPDEPPGIIGPSPPERGQSLIPADPAEHAVRVAREWGDVAEVYIQKRMRELGIPEDKIGATDPYRRMPWHTFDLEGRTGGNIPTGITVNSGALNPELLKGGKGGRLWPKARLRDRIDAIITHEFEEDRHGTHEAALKAAPKTGLPITDGARRVLRAMGKKDRGSIR